VPEKPPLFARPADLWSVLVVGAVVVVASLVRLVGDVARLLPNHDVPVDVLLTGAHVELPVGPGGALVPATVDVAALTVSDMPVATFASALGAAAVPPLATIAVTVCVLLLCRQMLAGRFFSRTTTRLITAVSVLIAGGWALHLACTVMATNGVLALVADPAVADDVRTPVSWTAILAAMAVGALAAAFGAGERMQRDTEGLV
jgi:hypothetical protein